MEWNGMEWYGMEWYGRGEMWFFGFERCWLGTRESWFLEREGREGGGGWMDGGWGIGG